MLDQGPLKPRNKAFKKPHWVPCLSQCLSSPGPLPTLEWTAVCSTFLLLPVDFYKLVLLPLTSVLSANSHSALAFGSPTQHIQAMSLTQVASACLHPPLHLFSTFELSQELLVYLHWPSALPGQFPACQNKSFCVLRTLPLQVNQLSGAIFLFRTVSHRISPSRALNKLGSSSEVWGCWSVVFLAHFSQDLKQYFLIGAAVKAALHGHFTNQFFFIHVK